jgi:hypothetical protein
VCTTVGAFFSTVVYIYLVLVPFTFYTNTQFRHG